jgi:two-component system chemotaxis response regulator CheY
MKRCLVIDDSTIMRNVARLILEDLDFETAEAEDTDAAMEFCRAGMPELVLLDLDLPNANSIEFVGKLRHERGGERPIIVFCTTDNDVLQISQALAAGANDYVLKPFDRETLQSKLANAGLLQESPLAATESGRAA